MADDKLIEALERVAELNHGSKESAIASKALEEYRRTPAVTVSREAILNAWIKYDEENPSEGNDDDSAEAWIGGVVDAIYDLQLPAPRAEAIKRQDIAKCFESKLEIYLTLKERNELQEWCNQTIDNIMALQIPAPQPVSTGEHAEFVRKLYAVRGEPDKLLILIQLEKQKLDNHGGNHER